MHMKGIGINMSEENTQDRKKGTIELIIVIMLGITAVATAWSSWQGSQHGSLMDQQYATANLMASEGNSEYNAGIQSLMQDMLLYNEINSLLIDMHFAELKGDADEEERLSWKLDRLITGNMSDEFEEALMWAMAEEERRDESVSPFELEDFVETYFELAFELLEESEEMLEIGNEHSTHGDNLGLVAVIYAVVLFLLGISATFKKPREKCILLVASGIGFLVATIFMFTIPTVFPS